MLREQAPAGFTLFPQAVSACGGGGAQGLRALRIDSDYDSDQDFVGFDEARDEA
jgi:hypothetical protein